MDARRWPWLVASLLLAFPPSASAVDWVTPVSPVSGSVPQSTTPLVASNARGDTAVAWLDGSNNHIYVSDRPVGGTFSMGTEVSTLADQQLGSLQLDDAGNIYVFFITEWQSNANSQPNVAVRPVGGTTWDTVKLAVKQPTLPAFSPIAGAVAPDGRAVAAWLQGNINNATLSKVQYSTKAAGSSTWAGKLDLPGATGNAPGPFGLAINSSGEAAIAFTRQACSRRADGATMNASGTWTTINPLHTCANNSLGVAAEPLVGIDEEGNATAVWARNDAPPMGSGNDLIQFTTKAIAAAAWPTATASPSPNDLSVTGANASSPSLAVAPDGTTTVAWIRSGVIETRTRVAGSSTFGSVTTIPTTLTSPVGVRIAAASDGSVVAVWSGTNSTPKPAIGAARRAPGAATFAALPNVPAEDNASPSLAIDGEGNAPAAWVHQNTGPTWAVNATGLDAAGPAISGVTFPGTAGVNEVFPYGATLTDRWSGATAGVWSFGDGTTGPLNGTKSYGSAGTFGAALTASDSIGNTSQLNRSIVVGGGGGPGGGGSDTQRPAFLSARLTNTTFRVNPSGAAETPVATRAKKGTTFVYSLSESARVVFRIQAKKKGRRVRRRCVKPTRRNRDRRACTRFVKVGAFAQAASAGQNRKRFSGKIGGKRLRPGKYRATLIATDAAGNVSRRKFLNFKVVRR
jgi:hypothetical protein